MIDDLAGIDFGADFDAWAPGTELVTVRSIDAISGATLAIKADVVCAILIDVRATGPGAVG